VQRSTDKTWQAKGDPNRSGIKPKASKAQQSVKPKPTDRQSLLKDSSGRVHESDFAKKTSPRAASRLTEKAEASFRTPEQSTDTSQGTVH
jgi:hypothetical protein